MALVSFDAALASPGLRLVLLSGVPSPWSQAALAILRYKQLAFVHGTLGFCNRCQPLN